MTRRQRLQDALKHLQAAKQQLEQLDMFALATCADCGGLDMMVLEIETELRSTGPTAFDFGANVKPSNSVTFPPGTRIFNAPAVPQAPFLPLKCWHNNTLELDGPAAECGCKLSTVTCVQSGKALPNPWQEP